MSDAMMKTPTVTPNRWTRRRFLAAGGATGAGLVLVGGASSGVVKAQSAAGDLAAARLAASLEVLAVATYRAALGAANDGKLGPVPPAVATFIQTAQAQHQFALEQWNAVITGAGSPAVNAPPADLNATVQQAFGQVTDVRGAAELALLLEQTAADTYLVAIPALASPAAIDLAGNLQIIDQQHASILLYVLGRYPVPDTFQTGAKAVPLPSAAQPAPSPAAAKPAPAPAAAKPAAPAAPVAMPRTGNSALAATGLIYTVQPGDSLASISQAVYGSEAYTGQILANNLDVLASPEELQPGMVLTMPPADGEVR